MTPEEYEDEMDWPRSFNGHSGDPGDALAKGLLGIFGAFLFIMVFCATLGPYLP
jgi:hypothetical protein